ncbi:MAG TPA: PorV/PorQ family protein [Gemmatimonadales bacterium]|nr:PorV/PorQ family protein [Gemmatimonadales bacterium]
MAVLAAWRTGAARAQGASAGIEGGAFLLVPVGARAVALGEAATADGNSSEAVFWNPAGLAGLTKGEFALYHYDAFFGSGDAVAIAVPSSRLGTFAVTAYLVNYGDLAVTRGDLGPEPVGQISPRNLELMASYATDVGGLAAGISYKLVQFRVDCTGDCTDVPTATGTTHAVDLGVQYAFAGWRPVVIGVSLRNLGFNLQVNNRAQADPLPTRLSVGVSAQVVRPAEGEQGLDARVLADVQGTVLEGPLTAVTLVGVESGVGSAVRLRFGYAFLNSSARGPSLGFGVKFGSIAFDLARTFNAAQDVGDTEPVQVTFRVVF